MPDPRNQKNGPDSFPTGKELGNRQPGIFYGYIIVGCSFIILLISFGLNYSFGIFFNSLLADLGWSRAVTSTGYAIAQFIGGFTGIITGRLSDSFGPRVVVIACGLSLAAGCFLMSRVHEVWQMYFFYGLLIGTGYGGASIPLTSTISRWFVSRRGLMTGIVVSGIGCGTVLMPLLASRLLAVYDWRYSFVIIGIIVLAVVIPAALFLKRDPSGIGRSAYGMDAVKDKISPAGDTELTWRQALQTGRFWIYCFICLFFGFFVQSVMVHIVPHARTLGIEAERAALIMSFLGLGSIAGRIIMGSASDRIGVRYTLVIALGLMLLAFLWLQMAAGAGTLYVFAVVYGFAYGTLIAMLTLTPARMFGLVSLGTLVGIVTFVYTAGGTLGPIVTGYIFDITQSYRLAFIVCTVLAAAGLVLAASLRLPRGGPGKKYGPD